jgi:hypothetical protein
LCAPVFQRNVLPAASGWLTCCQQPLHEQKLPWRYENLILRSTQLVKLLYVLFEISFVLR